jgi:hypothetical protein
MRLVELSPFIPWTNQPVAGLIVTQGTSFTLTSGATFASNPLTNTWYLGSTNGPFTIGTLQENGIPTAALVTNIFAATNAITNITVTSIQAGTNYISTWSDQAGAITNYVSVIEVVSGFPDVAFTSASPITTNLTVTVTGNAPPTYTWKFFGTNLVNNAKYGATTNAATLWITNASTVDSGVYSNLVTNAYGSVVVVGTVTIHAGAANVVVTPAAQTNVWGANTSFTVVVGSGDPPFTYQWKKGGADIIGATTTLLSLPSITAADSGSYTAGVTNLLGGSISTPGVLTEVTPPPVLSRSLVLGPPGFATLGFTSTNPNDTASAFTLQSSLVVTGPYTNNPAAVISGSYPSFSVVVPVGSDTLFFKLKHSN